MNTELALMRQSLDTVIEIHGKELAENKVTIVSAHTKIGVLELQTNTLEVKVAQVTEKVAGTFGKTAIVISTTVAVITLVWNLI